jgi:hypothetical protein
MTILLDEKAIQEEIDDVIVGDEFTLFKVVAHAQARAILTAIEEADQSGSTPRQSRIAILRLIRQLEAELDSLLSEAGKKENRPKIVCLCGSTRFVDIYNEYRKIFTLKGYIVLSIEIVTTQTQKDDPQYSNPELKHMLDELHKRKIDLADEVFIINKGGYIGESTHSEIEYAKVHNKIITYLEPTPPEGR